MRGTTRLQHNLRLAVPPHERCCLCDDRGVPRRGGELARRSEVRLSAGGRVGG